MAVAPAFLTKLFLLLLPPAVAVVVAVVVVLLLALLRVFTLLLLAVLLLLCSSGGTMLPRTATAPAAVAAAVAAAAAAAEAPVPELLMPLTLARALSAVATLSRVLEAALVNDACVGDAAVPLLVVVGVCCGHSDSAKLTSSSPAPCCTICEIQKQQ
jgi:hypothetical protein